MTKIYNIKLLALMFLLQAILIISCDKDDVTTTGNVQLLSFGPTGAMHGDTLRFFGNNLNSVTEVDFTGDGAVVPQSAFVEQTSQIIRLVVPIQAEQGFVTLKTAQGDIVSKTRFNLMVAASVSSLPVEGRPGENITITGNYLNWVTRITFADDKSVDTFVSRSLTQIVVKIPMDAQTGPLTLNYGGTEPGEMETDDTLKVTLPMVTALSPNPIKHQQDVTITGTNLNLVAKVMFTGVSTAVTTFVSQSATQIVLKVPETATKGKITLVALSGVTTQSSQDLDLILPVITSMSPAAIRHQEDLTITGTNLDLAKSITFTGSTTAVTTFVSQTATQIVLKVPATANTGKVTIATSGGVSTQSSQELQLIIPVITTISPNPIDVGANLTVTGTNLDLVASVTFNNAAAITSFVSQTATQLVVKVPAGVLKGKVVFSVMNSTLTVESPDALDVNGAVPPPTIAFPIYNDAITSNWTNTGWIGGGWGGMKDLNNTSPVREGVKSIKIDYVGGYGSPLQLGHGAGSSVNISAYSTFKISIYGAPGSAGKKVNIGINGADKYDIIIVEGKWTDYSIPVSSLTSSSALSEILIKEYSGTGGFTIYVDALGLN